MTIDEAMVILDMHDVQPMRLEESRVYATPILRPRRDDSKAWLPAVSFATAALIGLSLGLAIRR